MKIKFNSNKIINLKDKMKLSKTAVLAGVLATTLLLSGCNKTILDTKYGFNKALIMGDDSSIILDVEDWKDYSGEQIQLTTSDNFVLLTSSFDINCFYGESNNYSINEVAKQAVESDEVYTLTQDENGNPIFNKDLLDTNWSFNKSITFNGNNALILPVGDWKDYQGEQLQVVTKDGLELVLSSYHSKLVCDNYSNIIAHDFAKSYVGSDGKVVDLSNGAKLDFNYDIIDTNYDFNKALIIKDDTCTILPITEWTDYEGEQLQIKFNDGTGILTSFVNTTLISGKTEGIEEVIANAFSGDLQKNKNLVKVYK